MFTEGDITHNHPEPHSWLNNAPLEAHHPSKVHGSTSIYLNEPINIWHTNSSGKDIIVNINIHGKSYSGHAINSHASIRDVSEKIVLSQISENDTGMNFIYFSHPYSILVPDGYDYKFYGSSNSTLYASWTIKFYLNTIE